MSEPSTRPASPEPDAREPAPIEVGDVPFALTGSEPAEPEQDEDEDAGGRTGRSRTRAIVLGSLLAAALAGATVMGVAGWRIASQKDATLTAPPQVATLRADDSESGRQTADYLTTALAAEVDLNRTAGAVYSDPGAADRGVLFFGGTTLLWTPESDLETAFELLADDQGAVTGLQDVDAGPLGGSMKCGSTKSDDGDMAVCGWADHGSLALAMFPNRAVDESAGLLRDIRSAAQTRD
jgi:hypothetical protein